MAFGDDVNANPASGFFWGNNPNVNQQLRQRIAAQMMSQKKGYPKTLGEGLSAIGDSLGDIGMARRLEQGDLAQQAQARNSSIEPAVAAAPATAAQAITNAIGGGAPEAPTPAPVQSLASPAPDPRAGVTAALMGQKAPIQSSPIPPVVPTQPIAPTADIAKAPPIQAAPTAQAGYVSPVSAAPKLPDQTEVTAQERAISKLIQDNPNNSYVAQKWAPKLQELQDQRKFLDARNVEQYKADVGEHKQMNILREGQLGKQAIDQLNARQLGQQITQGEQNNIVPAPAAPAPQASLLGTPQSPQRTGVPTAPPVPPGISPLEHSKQYAPILTAAVQAEAKATPEFEQSIKLIQQLRDHPGREWGLGLTGKIAGNTPGTDAYAFHKLLEQVQGKQFLQAYQSLKGGGAITEIEGTKATQALARLNAAQSKEEFDKAVNELDHTMRGDTERTQRKINKPVTAWRGAGDNATTAPDLGEVRGNGQYIGGNPADPMSWKMLK